ncbi:serine hydrolase domain-containing protein [Streptomyces sp. NPDC090106]|uniref:serine hydrolase domain-containing protein n=1 Tax=Streptomyces sp. NPDC090106 TaxID=3365946 RepID=UPI00380F068C
MTRTADRLREAITRIDAPDVVLAVSRNGERTMVCGGRADRPDDVRLGLRYELGSLTKTFTGLLLAELTEHGVVTLNDPVTRYVSPRAEQAHHTGITLHHLVTHTSGLPRLPPELLPSAVLFPRRNPYTAYGTAQLLKAFTRTRARRKPGTAWRYSNFGAALLGQVLARATGTPYLDLLRARVLEPLGLKASTAKPEETPGDAVGHDRDGTTQVRVTSMGAFAPAASVRTTPGDLLTYLEAHLRPGSGTLGAALRHASTPQLRHGRGLRETHTLTWFQHPATQGPVLFHPGATFGQQAFAALHPASGTALVALATQHFRTCHLVPVAYDLLHELADDTDRQLA